MTSRTSRPDLLCMLVLGAACSGQAASRPPGPPSGTASEQDVRNDLLRLHRDQEAFRIRYGAYAPSLQDLDFRVSDDVLVTLRRVTAESYYATAGSSGITCVIGGWGAKKELPVDIQTRLIAPGTPSCEADGGG